RAHVALHGAFSGSADATPMVAVGLAGGGALCTVATTVANVVFHGGIPGCASLSTFPSSVLMDLVPQVMQVVWGPWIDATPVPTLTTAGGHPTSIDAGPVGKTLVQNLVRHVLHEGFDDGVLTDNSQCANPNPTASWPSGYVARPGIPLLVRVFDFGHPQRGVGYFIDQAIDPKLAGNSLPVFAAGACTPFVAPDGMVQPINYSGTLALWATRPDNPLDRYKNHYSFLLTASDHSIGPTGPFELPGLCYEETSLLSNTHHCNNDNSDNYEETRAITDPAIYSTGLVNSAMKTMVVESVKGKRIKIGKKKFWIWKRVYHTLAGSKQMIELDYVFKYVLK
ncbi:MAG TPA: hypothetical protein VNY84_01280, partial [Acidimicrobiales bacterium]|nr:hypothetical protein [Acidimicrobiales bacterium]